MNIPETLQSIRNSIDYLYPEIWLVISIVVVLLISLSRKDSFFPVVISIGFVLGSSLLTLKTIGESQNIYNDVLRIDGFGSSLKLLIDTGGILALLLTLNNKRIQNIAEFCLLILAITLGSHLLVMSQNLLITFLSIEIISISSYILTAFGFDKKTSESSLKYFLFGSIASAIMLYGFTLLYGFSGTLQLKDLFAVLQTSPNDDLLIVALIFSFAGILFKLSAAPLHLWAPDVYETAPTPFVAFLSVVPKIAMVGFLGRFIFSQDTVSPAIQLTLTVVIIVTLTFGNFAALVQRDVKRLMAYSSIAQSGFLILPLVAVSGDAIPSLLFYATVYLIMNFLVFHVIQKFEKHGAQTIESYGGAGKTFLWPSLAILIGLISLTGLPPTAGFTGKILIFTAVWESYEATKQTILLLLLAFGLLNTVVSLFYYLKIPYYAFLKETAFSVEENIISFPNLLSLILVLWLLVLFFIPQLLMGWINKVNFVF